jgi:hypothetical protein
MFYGLDVHKQFIQVCRIDDEGKQRCDFRIDADRDSILAFAESLTEHRADFIPEVELPGPRIPTVGEERAAANTIRWTTSPTR